MHGDPLTVSSPRPWYHGSYRGTVQPQYHQSGLVTGHSVPHTSLVLGDGNNREVLDQLQVPILFSKCYAPTLPPPKNVTSFWPILVPEKIATKVERGRVASAHDNIIWRRDGAGYISGGSGRWLLADARQTDQNNSVGTSYKISALWLSNLILLRNFISITTSYRLLLARTLKH